LKAACWQIVAGTAPVLNAVLQSTPWLTKETQRNEPAPIAKLSTASDWVFDSGCCKPRRMQMLNFDRHQFDGKFSGSALPASVETSIAISDYKNSMHTESHAPKPRGWTAPFALNDAQLQKVLLLRAWRYVHGAAPFPENVNREKINRAATAKARKGHPIRKSASVIQHEMQARHKAAIQRAGGFMELWAAVAYRSWRLNEDSVAIAEALGITPWCVRVQLWRLREAAKQLGFDVGRVGHAAGKPHPRGRPIDAPLAVKMYRLGASISQLERHFGGVDGKRVRALLVAAGLEIRTGWNKKAAQKVARLLKQKAA
jgi:hypothetical protein